jgi:hypothetical protein
VIPEKQNDLIKQVDYFFFLEAPGLLPLSPPSTNSTLVSFASTVVLVCRARRFHQFHREAETKPRIYCDMTSERRNSPLLENGSLKRVSAATDALIEIKALL